MKMIDDLQARIDVAVATIEYYGVIDGSHHKQFVIDQVLRDLLEDGYSDWVSKYEEDCNEEWDQGIAP